MDTESTYMEQSEGWSGKAPSLEDLRTMRLTALLNDVVDELGQVQAAQELGIDRKTLWRSRTTGKLTPRLSDALERLLLSKDLSEAMREGKRIDGLTEGVSALAEQLRDSFEIVTGETKAFREEHGRAMRHVERRLVALESGRNRAQTPPPVIPEPDPNRKYVPPRKYPQLVTVDAEEGEKKVYGDATPVIVEWREARTKYLRAVKTGTTLAKVEADMAMLRLEIALIEKHELTLPRASYPWGREERRSQVRDRNHDLNRLELERDRAQLRQWLRRILTFGLWRN